jgi:hypothetical protein
MPIKRDWKARFLLWLVGPVKVQGYNGSALTFPIRLLADVRHFKN